MNGSGLAAVESLGAVYALVVDADPGRRTTVEHVLRYCGAYAQAAPSVERALAMMRQMRPDVLVVGVGGRAIGFALLDQVRSLKPDAGGVLPTIAIGPRDLEDAACAHGFDAYAPWPLEPWQLCRLVASVASR